MALAGKNGAVYVSQVTGIENVCELTSWSIDLTTDTLETTNFCSGTWRENVAGLKSWTGSCEGNWAVPTVSGQRILQQAFINGDPVFMRFMVDPTFGYEGSAVITRFGVNVPVDEKVAISFEFTGTSALNLYPSAW